MLERTFIAVKLDGVQRGLMGEIIKRLEQKGFCLVAMKFMHTSEDLLKEPVLAMVWEELNVWAGALPRICFLPCALCWLGLAPADPRDPVVRI
uniref:nucleoside-diphosphate kinase n=1 Tax=Erpetoichthys calabaricus TaxID=27687 RepID=A0A8C4TBV3_ERPCA